MALQLQRDGLFNARSQKDALVRRRSTRIRTLNAITKAITSLEHSILSHDYAADPAPELSSAERELLEANDLSKGRRFDESTLPASLDAVRDALIASWVNRTPPNASSASPAPTDIPQAIVSDPPTQAGTAFSKTEDPVTQTGQSEVTLAVPETVVPEDKEVVTARSPSKEASGGNNPSAHSSQPASSPSSPTAATIRTTPLPEDASPATSIENHPHTAKRHISPFSADGDRPAQGAVRKAVDLVTLDKDEEGRTKTVNEDNTAPSATAESQPVLESIDEEAAAAASVQPNVVDSRHAVADKSSIINEAHAEKPQRMQTRVASGVLRQKSVSEILDQSPKHSPRRKSSVLRQERSSADASSARATPSSRPQSESMPPPPPHSRSILPLAQEMQNNEVSLPMSDDGYVALQGAADDPSRDYLEPLYRIQAQDPPNGRALGELIHRANKTISTADQMTCYHERQDHRVLKRIYGLQNSNHWSLRHMQPCAEPPIPKTHWDYLLDEARWMRTDFRQERKAKRAIAAFLAQECADWVNANPDRRRETQVEVQTSHVLTPLDETVQHEHTVEPQSPAATTLDPGDVIDPTDEAVPDLEHSPKDDQSLSSPDTDMPSTPQYAIIPESLLSTISIPETSPELLASDELLNALRELPLYAPFEQYNQSARSAHKPSVQKIPSVSMLGRGKIVSQTVRPTRKRSRYDFEDEQEPYDGPSSKRMRASQEGSGLPPEQMDIALFAPENKHIKEKLHLLNSFRPPAEFPMPSEKFYEWRLGSQWTFDDDQKLRHLVKEFGCNWSLVSDRMQLPSYFHNAADRRTPWECFERWVELESLPPDMRKTTYFRVWGQKLENANRMADARYQAQLQHHAQLQNPNIPPPVKRRTMPTKIDKRRSGRYLHLIDSMRKLARKREQQQHKQAEAQKAASMRKQHESVQQKTTIHTPQEFSKLRHERDMAALARQEKMREAMIAQQKAAQLQRAGQNPQQAALAAQQQRQGNAQMLPNSNTASGHGSGQQGQTAVNGHHPQNGRMPGSQMSSATGHLAVPNGNIGGNVPQAQMQANMPANGVNQSQMSQGQIQRMAMQAQMKNSQMQNAQQSTQYQQQQMLSPGGNLNNMNGNSVNGQMSNQAALMAVAQQGGHNGMQQNHAGQMNGNAASPMPPPSMSQPKQLSSGHVPAINQIKHSLQAAYPQATPAQIDLMVNDQMRRQLLAAQARQKAVNAASGNYGALATANMHAGTWTGFDQSHGSSQQQQNGANNAGVQGNFNGATVASPQQQAQQQQYSQMMRQRLMAQQQQQLQNQAAVQANGSNISNSPRMQQVANASPNTMHVSPVMQAVMPNNNNAAGAMGMVGGQQQQQQQQQVRPPSRSMSGTPNMVRIPSSGSGMVSPGMPQGSPRAQMVKQ